MVFYPKDGVALELKIHEPAMEHWLVYNYNPGVTPENFLVDDQDFYLDVSLEKELDLQKKDCKNWTAKEFVGL